MDATKTLALIILVSVLAGLWFIATEPVINETPAPTKKPARKKAKPRKKKK